MDRYSLHQGHRFLCKELNDNGKWCKYSDAIVEIGKLQAKIDALMFEYCPDDMTEKQIAEYELHQEMTDYNWDVVKENGS